MTRIPLILLPGMPLDAAMWEHQRRHLEAVADITIPDLTGAGSIAALAGGVLAAAPERFALAGLSMGGYVAMEIMRRAPERVLRLALMDTNPFPDTPEQTANRRAAVELARQGKYRQVVASTMPRMIHPDHMGNRPLLDSLHAQAERVGVEGYARQQEAIIGRADSRPGLPAIACPTLVLCGEADALSPVAVHAEMAAAIPGARFVPVAEAGHMAPMEQPQAVTALMYDWLVNR